MNRHSSAEDDELGYRLRDALEARTARELGRPDSLRHIMQAGQPSRAGTPPKRTRNRRRLVPSLAVVMSVSAILAVVLVVHALATPTRPATPPAHPQPSIQPLRNSGSGYVPSRFYPAVRADGQPVIIRSADDQPVRILPRGRLSPGRYAPISPMTLSPDGNRLYGVGRDLQADGSRYPDGYGSEHVVYIDLKTNQFTSMATRDGLIAGFALSADGDTFAYALRGGQDGRPDRDVIYIHDIGRDRDRHFQLEPGQRTVAMALSPDGSQLAITPSNRPTDVRVISTLSADDVPGQQAFGGDACSDPTFGPLQWTATGLYTIRTCHPTDGMPTTAVIRWATPLNGAYTIAVGLRTEPATLVVQDAANGPVFFTGRETDDKYNRDATGNQASGTIPGFRLSGPNT